MSGLPLPGLGWEGPEDPVDRLIMAEFTGLPALGGPIVVLDDHTGELAPAVAKVVRGAQIRVHCDDLEAEQRLAAASFSVADLSAELFTDVRLVVLRLPRALAALSEYAELVAAHAHPAVRVVAGARIKHMTTGMNDVLGQHFGHVWASLGRQKSRVLHASGPRPSTTASAWPRTAAVPVPVIGQLTLRSHGAAFASGRLDAGTDLLLGQLADREWQGRRVVDLGCGTGILATWLAKRGAGVLAVDVSAAAVRSTRATASANGVGRVGSDGTACANGVGRVGSDGTASDVTAAADQLAAGGQPLEPGQSAAGGQPLEPGQSAAGGQYEEVGQAVGQPAVGAQPSDPSQSALLGQSELAVPGSGMVLAQRAATLDGLGSASVDAVVCNPPFHKGATKDSTPAFEMIASAARVLRPGGELWLVFNSHLPYLRALRRQVGDTSIVKRNRHYTVTRSVRG